MLERCKLTRMQIRFFLLSALLFSICFSQQNKLFWDGNDWNKVSKSVEYHPEMTLRVKRAYLTGVLDGRLYGYLKTWTKDQFIADDVFSETVDYLTPRELIKNLNFFYEDPLNSYIPIPSAIVIANMYGERVPIPIIEEYVLVTRRWINNLMLDLDTLNYSKLIEDKFIKHHEKTFNRSE
ncbi:MAG: hypothetical protein HOE56_05840 [Candidatus Marinimicrobia bacterium]|jgi:hypothetical protein|nr:hypothetical protein [Candidatus Neomarinimicrobiota bacterium]